MRRIRLIPVLLTVACALASGPAVEPPNHFFVFLRRPASAPQFEAAELERLQAAHLANIKRLYDEKHLVMAGPFLDDGVLRGIFVYTTTDPAAAQQWLATDPMVKAGRLSGDLHLFATAPATFHKTAADAKFEPEQYSMVIFSAAEGRPVSPALRSRHDAYVADLERSGKLAMAAHFDDGDAIPALLVLTSTPAEAESIATRDPYVGEGRMKAEVHPWMTQRGVLAR